MTSLAPATVGERRDQRVTERQRLALAVLLTASFTLAVDFSVLNVALPDIGADLDFSLANLQWIGTAFALCAAGCTLLFGRFADLFGRRRMFLSGIALLGASSLVGGLATVPWVLIVARAAQGLATAAVTPAALALLTTSFPAGPLRARALGLNGALMAAGFTTGAVLGGVLTDLLNWRYAFFINVAVAAVVLVIAPAVLVDSRPDTRPSLDVPGALSVTGALLAIVYGLTRAGQMSWGDVRSYGALLIGAALLVAFWVVESHVGQPLVPVHILRRRTLAWGNIAGLLAFATETSVVFLLTLYLQRVLGYSPLGAGVSFAVLGAGTVIGGAVGPKIIGRIGSSSALVGGFVAQAVATVPLVFLGAQSGWIFVLLVATFAGGIANLVAIVAFMVAATTGLDDEEQGLATGLATMSQQVGITMGIPIMSAIATARMHSFGAETPRTVLHGVSAALAVDALVCVVAAGLIAIFLRRGIRPVRTGLDPEKSLARRSQAMTAHDVSTAEIIAADQSFFHALLAADHAALAAILTDDFLIVDVMAGQVTDRASLIGAIESGALRFVEVLRDPDNVSLRCRAGVAVVVGRTRMTMVFQGGEASVDSRYTHIYVLEDGDWRLFSAQGTPVATA